jgi:hypothetical protein
MSSITGIIYVLIHLTSLMPQVLGSVVYCLNGENNKTWHSLERKEKFSLRSY